jgi:predicted dehydrogenase
MAKQKTSVAVVGCGYWGPNLIRNVAGLPHAELRALCDLDEARLQKMSALYNPQYSTPHLSEVLADPAIEAILLATSASSHYELAKQCLAAGKHLLVEKPITLHSHEALELIALAKAQEVRLMVGHTFQYNPAVKYVREAIQRGDLGQMVYAYMTRVNLGIIRDDLNVMWNLSPHDISILLWTFNSLPVRVSAHGFSPLRPNKKLEDIIFMLLEFENGAVGHIHNSWIDPNKIRQATFVGTDKMIVYDDVDMNRKVQIFDKGVVHQDTPASFGEFQLTIREGDILIPRIPTTEPVKAEVSHFIDCVQTGQTPISDGINGWQVVKILEAADQSIDRNGAVVEIDWSDAPR